MPNPQRRVPTFRGKKQPDGPPILPGMGLPLLRLSGLTAQQDFISEARALAPSEPPSTPLLFQAGQVPGSRAHSTALASVHMIELKDDTIIASDSFIDRLFPKERMPFPIDPRIFKALAKKGLWSHGKSLFAGVEYTEYGMAKWLNDVGNTMGEVYGHSAKRYWWHGSCNLPPSGAPINRKPDLVLLGRDYFEFLEATLQRVDWLRIRSFAEVTTEPRVPARMIPTINAKSYLSFILQFDRRFATSLSFIGSGEYSLTVTDRQGQIRYTSSLKSGLEPAQRFLTILAFFMFGNDTDIGLDSHFIRDPKTDRLVAVNVNDQRYELEERIYTVESLVGRGTNVWVVSRTNQSFVLKDSWVLENLVESEIVHLQAMMGHDEINLLVPTFIAGGDVEINGITDSTANYRGSGLLGRPRNQRIHRRVVTGPVGTPLTRFRTKKEFINAMIGAVTGKCLKSPSQ
jgi:hypothetical protein